MRHYVPNARTHCFPPANFPFIGFGPFETANDVKSKCDNTPNCYMFYRNNDRQYYTCPPKATVGEKLGFTLFTAGECYVLLTITICSLIMSMTSSSNDF